MVDTATVRLDRQALRRLAETAEPDGVLTVYVDLDAGLFPTATARRAEIDSLLTQARWTYAPAGLEGRNARLAQLQELKGCLLDGDPADDAGGIVAFCTAAGEMRIIPLEWRVPSMVVVDDSPYIEPLAGGPSADRWCVLLVDGRVARILYGNTHRLVQIRSLEDDVSAHPQAGCARTHVRRAITRTFDILERTGFDKLLVGATDDAWPLVANGLHPHLRSRLTGRIPIDVAHATPSQVLERARPFFDTEAILETKGVLDAARGGVGRGTSVLGLIRTLEALYAQRVRTLVVERALRRHGVKCTACGWLGAGGAVCPLDGETTAVRANVIEDAIDLGLVQGAEIVTFPERSPWAPPEGIAALLRF